MNRHDHDPLTPEEREIAQRLSQSGGISGPSAALDATILAAARAAAPAASTTPAAHRRRPRSRWPVGMGIAASLAVALGVAWQLRPQPDAVVVPAPAEMPARVVLPPYVPASPQVDAEQAPAGPGAGQTASTAQTASPSAAVPQEPPAPQALRQLAPPPAREADSAPIVFDAPEAMDAAPPPAPPPPPAPAAAAPAAMPAPVFVPAPEADALPQANRAHDAKVRSDDALRLREQRAAEDAESSELDRIEVTGSRVRRAEARGVPAPASDAFHDQPLDDQPPASFASPATRDAWLARIRELLRDGQRDAARESLREFVRRHPQHKVPDDLQPLLQE